MTNTLAEFKTIALVNTLRSCQLFTGLPQVDLEQIAAVTVLKSLEKDEYLFHEGDQAVGFYIVQRGAVNVHRVNAAGKEQIIHVFRVGDSFAEVALASATGPLTTGSATVVMRSIPPVAASTADRAVGPSSHGRGKRR